MINKLFKCIHTSYHSDIVMVTECVNKCFIKNEQLYGNGI